MDYESDSASVASCADIYTRSEAISLYSRKILQHQEMHNICKENTRPVVPNTLEEASKLLNDAIQHEEWSKTFQDYMLIQLCRSRFEVQRASAQLRTAETDLRQAELQRKAAENYVSSVINELIQSGFTIEDVNTSMPVLIQNNRFKHSVSVAGGPALSLILD